MDAANINDCFNIELVLMCCRSKYHASSSWLEVGNVSSPLGRWARRIFGDSRTALLQIHLLKHSFVYHNTTLWRHWLHIGIFFFLIKLCYHFFIMMLLREEKYFYMWFILSINFFLKNILTSPALCALYGVSTTSIFLSFLLLVCIGRDCA